MEKTRSYLPGKCRPFFFFDDNTHTHKRGCCISSSFWWRARGGEDRERATRTTRRSFARILRATRAERATPKSAKCSWTLNPLFFFIRAFLSSVFLCALLRRATRDVEKIRRRRRRHAISLFDGTKNRYRAFSKYNDKPGTGKTGYFDIPPNNYPFYMEEEK